MQINSQSYIPQALAFIEEISDDLQVMGVEDSAFHKGMLADTLIQLESAKQLGRIANSLDQLVRAMHR